MAFIPDKKQSNFIPDKKQSGFIPDRPSLFEKIKEQYQKAKDVIAPSEEQILDESSKTGVVPNKLRIAGRAILDASKVELPKFNKENIATKIAETGDKGGTVQDILDRARQKGKISYGDIARRTIGETIAETTPTNLKEVGEYYLGGKVIGGVVKYAPKVFPVLGKNVGELFGSVLPKEVPDIIPEVKPTGKFKEELPNKPLATGDYTNIPELKKNFKTIRQIQELDKQIDAMSAQPQIPKAKSNAKTINKISDLILKQEELKTKIKSDVITDNFTNIIRPTQVKEFGMPANFNAIRLPETLEQLRNVDRMTGRGTLIEKPVLDKLLTSEDLPAHAPQTWGAQRFANYFDKSYKGVIHDNFTTSVRNSELEKIKLANKLKTEYKDYIKNSELDKKDSTPLRKFIEEGERPPVGKEKAYVEASNKHRELWDNMRETLNNERKALNLEPIPYKEKYVTHIKQISMMEDLLGKPASEIPTKSFKDFEKPWYKTNPFAKQRHDAIPEELLGGAFEAMDAYIDKYASSLTLSKEVAKLRGYSDRLSKAGKKNTVLFLNHMADRLSGIPNKIDSNFIFGQPALNILNKLSKRFVSNSVVGNVSTVLNQVGSGTQLAVHVGTARTLTQIPLEFAKEVGTMMLKGLTNKEYTSFPSKFSQVFQQRVTEQLGEELSAKSLLAKPVTFTDRTMVGAAFNAGFKVAKKAGLAFEDAVKYADNIASLTQGEYTKAMRPQITSTKTMQSIMPLQTFVFNNLNLLTGDILSGKTAGFKVNRTQAISNMIATGFIINIAMRLTFGNEPSKLMDFIPGYGLVRYGAPGVFGLGVEGIKLLNQEKGTKFGKLLKRTLFKTIPSAGGGQLLKTTEGLVTIAKGGEKGKFKVKGIPETLRTLIFGKYGSKAAQEYFDKKDKNKK